MTNGDPHSNGATDNRILFWGHLNPVRRRLPEIAAACLLVTLAGCQSPVLVKRSSHPPVPIIKGFPNTYAFYPIEAVRLHEQGESTVEICVGPNGKLAAAPRIVRSTGFALLDRAALAFASATSGHWIPGLRNGVPSTYCHAVPINFELNSN